MSSPSSHTYCLLFMTSFMAFTQRYIRHEAARVTLETGALLNEACLRLVDSPGSGCNDRAYFSGACAQVMQRILVDRARQRNAFKHGMNIRPLEIDEALVPSHQPGPDLVALDARSTSLERSTPAERRPKSWACPRRL